MERDAALSRACVELGEVLNFGTVCIQLPVQVVLAEKQEQKKKFLNIQEWVYLIATSIILKKY